MAPQIIEDVIDWLTGRRRKKNEFYGGRVVWTVPGYGSRTRKVDYVGLGWEKTSSNGQSTRAVGPGIQPRPS